MDMKILVLIAAFIACASAHGSEHGGKKQFGHFQCPLVADAVIIQTIETFVTQESRVEIIAFLTSMTTPQGLILLKKFRVDPVMVQNVITKLNSTNAADVIAAKAQLQGMMVGLKMFAKSSELQEIFCIYQVAKAREMAIQVVQEATFADLQCMLNSFTAISAAVPVSPVLPAVRLQPRHFTRVYSFGIDFVALSTTLNNGGQAAVPEVKSKIVAWIRVAEVAQLDKAGEQYRAAAIKCLVPGLLTTLPPSANVTAPPTSSTVPRVPAQP